MPAVSGSIRPLDPSDTYIVIQNDKNAKGFPSAVADAAARLALPPATLDTTVFVLQVDTGETWHWNGSSWDLISTASGGSSSDVTEIPSGTIDGSNRVFTLSQSPNPPESLSLYLNGLYQRQGVSADYTLSGDAITFNAGNAPSLGSSLSADYTTSTSAQDVWGGSISGTINGTNDTFALASSPNPTSSLKLYLNGIQMRQGGSYDYVLSGATVVFNAGSVPQTGDVLYADWSI